MASRLRRTLFRLLITIALVALGVAVINLPTLIRNKEDRPALSLTDPFAPMSGTGTVPADRLPTDSARVLDALREVQDPEIDIGIVDLGLVHKLNVDSSGNVILTLTVTVPECPFARVIALRALNAVKAVPGVGRVEVRLDPSIGWTPDRLSPDARERFKNLFPDEPGASR
ncbi:MAG: metal-sulfur cluster assembly factor [bacterium]